MRFCKSWLHDTSGVKTSIQPSEVGRFRKTTLRGKFHPVMKMEVVK